MEARDTVLVRNILYEDLDRHVLMGDYLQGFYNSARNPDAGSPLLPAGLGNGRLRQEMLRAASEADLYWVSRDMLTVANAAANSLPAEAVVEEHLPPSREGLIVFEEPLMITDLRQKMLRTTAALWVHTGRGIRVYMLTDRNDAKDSVNIKLRSQMGDDDFMDFPRFTPSHVSTATFGEPLPMSLTIGGGMVVPPEEQVDVIRGEDGTVSWRFSQSMTGPMKAEAVPDLLLRILISVWRLMRQTLAGVEREEAKVPKSMRRWMERQKLPGAVTMILLRRREYERGNGDRRVIWSHRWLVRGHWRLQPYKDGRREWIFIAPFVKGPEDAPLHLRDTVGTLVR